MKKFIRVGLILLVVFFCTACNSQVTFFNSIENGLDIKSYKYRTEITLDVKAPSTADKETSIVMQQSKSVGTLSLKLQGQIMETGAFSTSVALSIKSSEKGVKTTEGYLDITDIIFKDNMLYVNIKQLYNFLLELGMYNSDIKFTDEMPSYLGLPIYELSDALKKIGGIQVDIGELNNDEIIKLKDVSTNLTKKYLETFKEMVTKIGSDILTDNKGVYEMEIGQKNLESLCDTLIDFITNKSDAVINGTISELQNVGAHSVVSMLNEVQNQLTSGGKESIVSAISELKAKLSEITTFSILGTSEIRGNVGERNWKMGLSFNGEVKHKIDKYTGLSFIINHEEREIAYTDVIITPTAYLNLSDITGINYDDYWDVAS